MFFDHPENEKPLDRIPEDGGYCPIFRKIACIGDSLASGEHESLTDGKADYHDYFEYSWGQFMARAIGATVFNLSRGGMTAAEYHIFSEEKGYWNDEYDAQAYIVALGVNDVTWAYEGMYCNTLGVIEDVNFSDWHDHKATFAGYYGEILLRIREKQPKARIFLMTMPMDSNYSEELNARMDRHRELLYEFAERLPFTYVMDFRKYAPDYGAKEFHDQYYLGGHLNAAGYLVSSKFVMAYMDYIIRHHMEDFSQVGFIGKGNDLHNEAHLW